MRRDGDGVMSVAGFAKLACPCGAVVDSSGTHGLSCCRSAGRQQRHSQLNDIIWRAMIQAKIPAAKEPSGLTRTVDRTSITAGTAAEHAAVEKTTNYSDILHSYDFVPVAVETLGA